MVRGTAMLYALHRLRRVSCSSCARRPSLYASSRGVSSTGHAEDSADADKVGCSHKNDRVGSVFFECFKGMEEFLVRRPGCPPQQPMTSPLFTTAAGVISSSASSSGGGGGSVRPAKASRSFFPGINGPSHDANAPGMPRETSCFSSISGTSESKRVGEDLRRRNGNDARQHEAQSPSTVPPTTSSGGQQMAPGNSVAATAAAHADNQRYLYAYGLWQNRNAALLQMGVDMQEMTSKACYLRDLHKQDLKDCMRHTTRFSLYVVFPFVLLICVILFNESTLYTAQLKHLRLVDYDAWLEANGHNKGRGGGGGFAGGAGGGAGGFGGNEQRR